MKIFHTADLHLNMKFGNYPSVQERLTNARYDTLDHLVELANEHDCDFFTIGGDLFDTISDWRVADLERVAKSLDKFEGRLVMILPGNHDYIEPDSDLWNRMSKEVGDRVRVKIFDADDGIFDLNRYGLNAHVYPAPCEQRHKSGNNIGWITETEKSDEVEYHIGLAHGSIQGVSPDFDNNYFKMRREELDEAGIDLWLLGHSHVTEPETPTSEDKIFNPGTPEPDGFNCRHNGHAFIFELTEDGFKPQLLDNTGSYRFISDEIPLNRSQDIEDLQETYATDEYQNVLLRLSIKGRLTSEQKEHLDTIINKIEDNVLYLEIDDSSLHEAITIEEIDKEFPEKSFPNLLLTELAPEDEESELPMQMAYDLIKKSTYED